MRWVVWSHCKCCTIRPIPSASWAKAVAGRAGDMRRSAATAAARSPLSSRRSSARTPTARSSPSNSMRPGVKTSALPARSYRQPNVANTGPAAHSRASRSACRAAKRSAWRNSASLNGLARKCVAPASNSAAMVPTSPRETSASKAPPLASIAPLSMATALRPSSVAPRASITATAAPLDRNRRSAPPALRAATTCHPAPAAREASSSRWRNDRTNSGA
ncbi:hypothetical protein D9M73_148130 [compost metagenome]